MRAAVLRAVVSRLGGPLLLIALGLLASEEVKQVQFVELEDLMGNLVGLVVAHASDSRVEAPFIAGGD